MTLEQILALLMAKFSGVRKDGLAQLAKSIKLNATTEEEAQALVDRYTSEQVTEFVNDYRKDVDKEISNGVKTAETNFKKKYNVADDGGTDHNPNPGTPAPSKVTPEDLAAIVSQAVQAAVKPFQEKLSSFEAGNIESQRLASLNGKLAEAPELFKNRVLRDYGRMKFDTDEDFNAFVTDTENDLKSYTQETSNQALSAFGRPVQASAETSKDVPSGVEAYLKETASATQSELGGKEF